MSTATNALSAVESLIGIALFAILIYVLIEAAEAAPMLNFETGVDDAVEDAVGGTVDLFDGGGGE